MTAQQPDLEPKTVVSQPYTVGSLAKDRRKSAIITGAGSGINFSFASLLLSKGCNVLIADLSLRPEAKTLFDKYSSNSNDRARAVFLKTDVTDWPQLSHMFSVAVQEFGAVDIVCPGAGIFDPSFSSFWEPPGSSESQDAVDGGRYKSLDINVTHPIRTTQLAISHFLNSGIDKVSPINPKRVVIVTSIAGQLGNLHAPIYVAAKHAMNGFIRSLGTLDVELGIRVNGVAPGVIKTPLWLDSPKNMTYVDTSKDQWATPEEVAEAMLLCVESPDLGGGKILEVGAQQTRLVEALNDPGPSGAGHTTSNLKVRHADVYKRLRHEGWGVETARVKPITED